MDGAEQVVLVDDAGLQIGTADKLAVHTVETPLHLAFSCHVYDSEGRVLVTRRAVSKLTWPGVWTNSFCGHPAPGEDMADALRRRAQRELGISIQGIEPVLPDFRYRAVDASGIVEHEICPVFRARTTDSVRPAADEVAEFEWVELDDLRAAVTAAPYAFSPWLGLQLAQLGELSEGKPIGAGGTVGVGRHVPEVQTPIVRAKGEPDRQRAILGESQV